MNYEWDENKAKENIRKHGVDFTDAVIALEDENGFIIEDSKMINQYYKGLSYE